MIDKIYETWFILQEIMYLILYRPVARDLIRLETKYSFEEKADQFKWHKPDKLDNLKKWMNLKKAEQKMLIQKILTPFKPLCFTCKVWND